MVQDSVNSEHTLPTKLLSVCDGCDRVSFIIHPVQRSIMVAGVATSILITAQDSLHTCIPKYIELFNVETISEVF